MPENKPKVSVLIPTYNSAAYLDEAITSVLNQTYTDFELIIVDNCSIDNTKELVQKYLSDNRVSYYRNDSNIGLGNNWNKCLELANGEYIKYLCSDDIFHPQLLEKFVPIMDSHPEVSLVTSDREEFGLEHYKNEIPYYHLQSGKRVIYDSLQTRNWLGEPTTVMFRRSNLHLGQFDPTMSYIIDWDMWLRHLAVGDCYIIPETLSYFRVHPTQHTKNALKTLSNYFEVYYFYKKIAQDPVFTAIVPAEQLQKLVKEKAAKCTNALPKLVGRLTERQGRRMFLDILRIIRSEHVALHSIRSIFTSATKKFAFSK